MLFWWNYFSTAITWRAKTTQIGENVWYYLNCSYWLDKIWIWLGLPQVCSQVIFIFIYADRRAFHLDNKFCCVNFLQQVFCCYFVRSPYSSGAVFCCCALFLILTPDILSLGFADRIRSVIKLSVQTNRNSLKHLKLFKETYC